MRGVEALWQTKMPCGPERLAGHDMVVWFPGKRPRRSGWGSYPQGRFRGLAFNRADFLTQFCNMFQPLRDPFLKSPELVNNVR